MQHIRDAISEWIQTARSQKKNQAVATDQLAELERIIETITPRQRLLYLHANKPSISAPVIGMAQHEPVEGGKDGLRTRTDWPYETVHDALIDGWHIVQFPDLMSPYDDREMSYVGYESVLQKIEEYTDAR